MTIQSLIEPLAAASVAVLLAGCSSPGYTKGNAAAAGEQEASAEVQAQSRSLDLTIGALRDLVNETNADLRPPYQNFCASLNHFETAARRTENSARRMAQRNTAYLEAWDKETAGIEYQHVREVSQTRKTEVANQVDAIHRRYEESQATVQPLISYLEDIRKALGADLTPTGIESMKGVAQNADASAAKVQASLAALAAALADSGARMSSLALQHTNSKGIPQQTSQTRSSKSETNLNLENHGSLTTTNGS